MMTRSKFLSVIFMQLLLLLMLSGLAHARTTDTYTFDDPVTETRYKALIKELRCPKCQNQNLVDSNSPIAADLRREVYRLLMQGKSDIEIVDFMVKRYGEFVLYRPKLSSLTYVLWFGPLVLIIFGVTVVIAMVRKRSTNKKLVALSSEQRAKLDQLLKDK